MVIPLLASLALMFFTGYIYAANRAYKVLEEINKNTEKFKADTNIEVAKMRKIVAQYVEDAEEAKKFYYSQEH